MEINLLKHSTYNVEQIRKNQEFFRSLLGQIESTYQIFNKSERSSSNIVNVAFAPTQSRIHNVFMEMKENGVLKMTFRSSKKELETLKDKYEYFEYSLDSSITMKNITHENYKEHLPNIVKCIEWCAYSFK